MFKKVLFMTITSILLCLFITSTTAFGTSETNNYRFEGMKNEEGLYEGYGKLFYKDKLLYEGEFKANRFNGKGILYNVSGTTDEEMDSDVMVVNQKKYEGTFLNGKYHGTGTLYYDVAINISGSNKGIQYQGKFSHGQYYGYGVEYLKDGEIHQQGYFINDKLYEYIGNLDENGKMHGQGKLINNEKEIMFEGAFEHGEIQGKGTLYNTNRKMRYEGHFEQDLLQGQGKIFVNDKLYYEGLFVDGLLEGEGTLFLPSQKIAYKGPFSFNRTLEQPFQVKAELSLNADMSATYSLYIVLLADHLTNDTLDYLNTLEEMAAPFFDKVQKNENKKSEYVALKATKEIPNIDEIYYDEFFGFNFVVNKTKLMIYEEFEVYAYLSVLNDPNLMNVSYEINLPNGAKNIRADGTATALINEKKYGWLDINDTNYKVIEFERKNNLNLFISAAFFLVLFIGILYFHKKKKQKKGKTPLIDNVSKSETTLNYETTSTFEVEDKTYSANKD